MFNPGNAYKKISLKQIFDMPDSCPVCKQRFDLEQGFWYGTGYVSYALAVAFSVSSFVAWWVLVGISVEDNRVFYWLGANTLLLIVLQPWLMRLSRVIYLYIFVRYDRNYPDNAPQEFDHRH